MEYNIIFYYEIPWLICGQEVHENSIGTIVFPYVLRWKLKGLKFFRRDIKLNQTCKNVYFSFIML